MPVKLGSLIHEILIDQHAAISKPYAVSSQADQISLALSHQRFSPFIKVTTLECTDIPLSQSIIEFAQQAITQNYRKLILIPVFLSAGVHVLEDIPEELSQAKRVLGNAIELELTDYVGNFPHMRNLVANRFEEFGSAGKIILAHGSRLRKGNVAVENLAKALEAMNAYWTIEPDLPEIVKQLVAQGKTSIIIVPYFLFVGRITDNISSQVLEMQKEFPDNRLLLDSPLGASRELALVMASQIKKYL